MIKLYVEKLDLSEDSIGKDIMFIYNGQQLNPKLKESIGSLFSNNSVISIYDVNDIIPYWNIIFDASYIKTEMEINKNKTIKDMMEAYANKICFPKEAIGKEVIFMHKGVNLDTKGNDIVKNVLREEKIVNIFDKGNVIGKLINNTGFSTFNMMNPNINNDFTKFNPNSSGAKDPNPRNPRTPIYDIINITFTHSNGRKVVVNMNSNKTIEDMIKEYANKNDFAMDSIEKNFMFLCNGAQLDHKSQLTLGSKFRHTAVITVYDYDNRFQCSFWYIRFVEGKNEFTMEVDKRKTIKGMMKAYANKISVPEEVIGKKIFFLYNGNDLSTKQNDSVESVLYDKATITVNHIIC
jgi:hypothetical protein